MLVAPAACHPRAVWQVGEFKREPRNVSFYWGLFSWAVIFARYDPSDLLLEECEPECQHSGSQVGENKIQYVYFNFYFTLFNIVSLPSTILLSQFRNFLKNYLEIKTPIFAKVGRSSCPAAWNGSRDLRDQFFLSKLSTDPAFNSAARPISRGDCCC